MANKLKAAFLVEWNNAAEPTQGYKYLYLSAADNAKFTADGSVKTQAVQVDLVTHPPSPAALSAHASRQQEMFLRFISCAR
jgi:hypothetical protein